MKYITKTLFDLVNNPSYISDLGLFNNETFDKFRFDTIISLCGAYIRDDSRMVLTEKLMLMIKLLVRNVFSNLNTSGTRLFTQSKIDKSEELKNLIKEFSEANSHTIETILSKCSDTETDFNIFFDIINSLDLNPLDLLSILEPTNNAICDILRVSLSGIDHKDISNYKFASSRFIILNKKEEDKFFENSTIYDTILIGRLLPLLYFISYYMQNGYNLIATDKISDSFEVFTHSTYLSSTDGSNRLYAIHENNDNTYKAIRDFANNPLHITPMITKAINHCVFIESRKSKSEENEEE